MNICSIFVFLVRMFTWIALCYGDNIFALEIVHSHFSYGAASFGASFSNVFSPSSSRVLLMMLSNSYITYMQQMLSIDMKYS